MRIIISDFDGTFFTNKYLDNIKVINKFVAKGNMFVIATGRNITQLKKDISGYNINYSYLICNDGGIIFDKHENVLYRKNINPNIVKPIFNMLNEDKSINIVYIDDSVHYNVDTKASANAIIGMYTDKELANQTLIRITDKYPEVHGYLSDNWVNITDISVNKAKGIERLIDIINIDKNDIYTVGDNINDIEMLNNYHGYLIEDDSKKIESCSEGIIQSFKELIDILEQKKG